MPRSARSSKNYYAVAVGRDAPGVYTTWDECNEKVFQFSGAIFKSFLTKKQAEEWLATQGRRLNLSSTKHPELLDLATTGQSNPLVHNHTLADISMDDVEPSTSGGPSFISLSPEQRQVLDRVRNGHSVFFTGSAGTGKSVLLRTIMDMLRPRHGVNLGVTASTGIAAIHIGGRTLHSWAGIGQGTEPTENYVRKFTYNKSFKQVRRRWQHAQALIIDEISMIDGALFDKLESIARQIRVSNAPFGGIQLILSGDFCQLPPVPGRDPKTGQQIMPVFAFDAATWNDCVGTPVILTRVFRQRDQAFVDMLNAMRFGQVDANSIAAFSALSRKVEYNDGIEPIELFPTRDEVETANATRLQRLETEIHTYPAHDRAGYGSNGQPVEPMQMARLLDRLVAPQEITVKVDAQVMLIKNLIQGELVNGSIGQVVRFDTAQNALDKHMDIAGIDKNKKEKPQLPKGVLDSTWPIVRFIRGQEVMMIPQEFSVTNIHGGMEALREQVPLILAWALSVHKSQGQTLERVKVNLERTFEKGQAYVALSRATCLEQLEVANFSASKVEAHPRVLEWYSTFSGPLSPTATSLEPQKKYEPQVQEVIELFDSDDEDQYWAYYK